MFAAFASSQTLFEARNYPDTINHPELDQVAMLSAYLKYMAIYPDCSTVDGEWLPLSIKLHKNQAGLWPRALQVHRRMMPFIKCRSPDCAQCRAQPGSYEFRWFSPQWAEDYMKWAQPGKMAPQWTIASNLHSEPRA